MNELDGYAPEEIGGSIDPIKMKVRTAAISAKYCLEVRATIDTNLIHKERH
jgi:hypothetical protein